MTEPRILKIVFELRYPHAALLLDNRGSIARKFRGAVLTDWQISSNEVTLFNKEQSTYFNVKINKMHCLMENPGNIDAFCDLASEFSLFVLGALGVSVITRIGLRIFQIDERDNFENLVKNIRERLCGFSDSNWAKLGVNAVDVGISHVLQTNDHKMNLSIGPMEKEQLSTLLTSKETINSLPDVSLFVDTDLFSTNFDRQKISRGKLSQYLTNKVNETRTLTQNFIRLNEDFK